MAIDSGYVQSLEVPVATRLRALQIAFGIKSYAELGAICGASASVVGNWMSEVNLPRVPEMARLCDRTGVTLDWIYRGRNSTIDAKMAIHLAKIIDGTANATGLRREIGVDGHATVNEVAA